MTADMEKKGGGGGYVLLLLLLLLLYGKKRTKERGRKCKCKCKRDPGPPGLKRIEGYRPFSNSIPPNCNRGDASACSPLR